MIAFGGALYNANIEHLYIGRNWSYFNRYGGSAFPSNTTTVEIGNSVTELPAYAFSKCSGLTSVTIPNSVNTIGAYAFEECSGLTSVIIPNSVNSIGNKAFYDCYGLKKSAYPSGLSNPFCYIDDYYVQTNYGIFIQYPREDVIIEDGFVYGPEKNAIYFAPYYLEGEYVIPEYVTKIGNSAFKNCSSLTSVTIPNSVNSIGEYAFSRCSGITSVKATAMIPPLMGDDSFYGLYATAALSVPVEATTDYLATNWSLFKNLRMGDSEAACQTYETGNLKYMLIPGKTDADKKLAVVIPGDYSSLTEVTIPERVTVSENGKNVRYYVDGIGFKAFNGCSDLATITFNSRNASRIIGEYAFAGTKIAALSIPATAETIGNHAFDGCKSLTGIVIPGSVESIGDYAFNSCTALTEITVPGSVESIGDYAFNSCTALTEITVPGSVESIGDYAFNSCTALTNANLEAGVKTIGDYAFYNTHLNEITLNEGLETIGEKCFSASRDGDIEPVYIPSTLKSVGADAFMNFNCRYVNISDLAPWCNIDFGNENSNPAAHSQGLYLNGEKIEDLVIPESVNAIKDFAFCYNSGLKSVKFNDALQSIGESAFKYCGGLTAAVIPGNVTAISSQAFATTGIKDITFAYSANLIEIDTDAFPGSNISFMRPSS